MTKTSNAQQQPTKPLKVAILHYACLPVVGGVEGIMSTHARLLEQAGHEVCIVAGRGDPESAGLHGVMIPELNSKHPEILRVQNGLREDKSWALPEFEAWTERIESKLLEVLQDTDICIVHNAFTLHKNLALTAALTRLAENNLGAKRWIAWCHDLAWNNPLYATDLLPRWPWTPLKYPLPNVVYVAISEQRRQEMAALFRIPADDIALVPNGMSAIHIRPFIAAYEQPAPGTALGREGLGVSCAGADHAPQEPGESYRNRRGDARNGHECYAGDHGSARAAQRTLE